MLALWEYGPKYSNIGVSEQQDIIRLQSITSKAVGKGHLQQGKESCGFFSYQHVQM